MSLDKTLNVRIAEKTIQLFKAKCVKLKQPYTWVLREMIEAYNDGRLVIKPKGK